MNELQIIYHNEQKPIDSREIAEMVYKNQKDLLCKKRE